MSVPSLVTCVTFESIPSGVAGPGAIAMIWPTCTELPPEIVTAPAAPGPAGRHRGRRQHLRVGEVRPRPTCALFDCQPTAGRVHATAIATGQHRPHRHALRPARDDPRQRKAAVLAGAATSDDDPVAPPPRLHGNSTTGRAARGAVDQCGRAAHLDRMDRPQAHPSATTLREGRGRHNQQPRNNGSDNDQASPSHPTPSSIALPSKVTSMSPPPGPVTSNNVDLRRQLLCIRPTLRPTYTGRP